MSSDPSSDNEIGQARLVPPQLPSILANVFKLRPIVGSPSPEEVKLVHEGLRALNNLSHSKYPSAPELRDTSLSTELSQYLFDIQMACHRQKYPVNVLPNDVVYTPPSPPNYISVQLKPITGFPSNEEIASVHNALRISESFGNVPSIFDADVHAQLSQHLFDIQFARHIQRSIVKQSPPIAPVAQNEMTRYRDSNNTDASDHPKMCAPHNTTLQETGHTETEPMESQHTIPEQPNLTSEAISHQSPNKNNDLGNIKDLMVEIRDTLKNVKSVLIGTQNSLARGFNSSSLHSDYRGHPVGYDIGAHSLINDQGEVPEMYNLPTFKYENYNVLLAINDLAESVLARYLRFYSIGEEMIEEEEELKIKSGMIDDARKCLSARLFLNR